MDFTFNKIRLVQLFNQDYLLSSSIMIIKYCARVQYSRWTLTFMFYEIGYLGMGYSYRANSETKV